MGSRTVQITVGAVVCVEADLKGEVTIGTKTIVHPCAKIYARNGPIIIGESNIIEERVIIENNSTEPMYVGDFNVFEVSCEINARSIGDNNFFGCKCIIGEEVVVGNGCKFGPGTIIIDTSCDIPDKSVLNGNPLKHSIASECPAPQVAQVEFLRRVLPNFHNIINPTAQIVADQSTLIVEDE